MTLSRLLCALLVLTAGIPGTGVADEDEAPLADAGLDQTVAEGSVVYLDGGGTVDPDGDVVDYSWSIETPRGTTIRPTDPNAELTRFVAESTGRYRVTLTVRDDEGNSRSDTLFVDVTGAPPDAGDASPPSDGSNPDTGGSEPAPDSPPELGFDGSDPTDSTPTQPNTAPITDGSETVNQAPFGEIYGPNSIPAGRVGRFTVEATDSDGQVVDFWWSPPEALSMQGRELNAHTSGTSYTFDVEPGTSVQIPVVLVDNGGARSTISKTVDVTNNQPDATLVGNSTVVVGAVEQYEAVASDPDGPITSYRWTTDSSVARVDTGGLLDGGVPGGQRSTLVRFTEIPQDDATVTVAVTVADEHGGEKTVRKEVTVVDSQKERLDQDSGKKKPVILSLKGKSVPDSVDAFGNKELSNRHKFSFSAVASDSDSERLVYKWTFGEEGSATTIERGDRSESTVEFMFEGRRTGREKIPISVVVKDQNGQKVSRTKYLSLKAGGAVRDDNTNIKIDANEDGIITGFLTLPNRWSNYDVSRVKLHFGDGTTMPITSGSQDQVRFNFQHEYRYGGTYTLYVFDGNNRGTAYGREDVTVEKRTFTEWTYERKIITQSWTVAKEQPGGEWHRAGVDNVKKNVVETREMTTPIVDGAAVNPGSTWTRIGTEVEYHTEYRTTRATESPGARWERSELNVDKKTVQTGWGSVTVAHRGVADSSWEYVGKVSRTVSRTESQESTSRPRGAGWQRAGSTGDQELSGYDYQWTSYRYGYSSWDYVRSDRYLDHWDTERKCVEYGNYGGYQYCIDHKTTREPVYDYRHLYRVPKYDTVYRWERTVDRTVYDHEYRYPTYTQKAIHEYTKEVQVAERYATWEQEIYETSTIYKWSRSTITWENRTSLARPSGPDIRNVRKTTKRCGDSWNVGEPEICVTEDPK